MFLTFWGGVGLLLFDRLIVKQRAKYFVSLNRSIRVRELEEQEAAFINGFMRITPQLLKDPLAPRHALYGMTD